MLSHLPYHSDLLHVKSRPFPGKSGSLSGNAQVLAGAAANDTVNDWSSCTVDFGNVT
jgi:hypothetical protein